MAGAFHGDGEPETVINVGISGPGVVRAVLSQMDDADLGQLSETIKRTAFKITRMGELVGREMADRLDVEFGIVDLSLAPTPAEGDSVANILEVMGLERCGTHGTTAALALLTDAVKKGGAMATSYTGGLSGAFIPVSEDAGMVEALKVGAIGIDKLEAMTSVCSVGLDMIVVPGDTAPETISAIIADECAIGMVNAKTTGVRIIPAGKEGEYVEFGGLLGGSPVMGLNKFSSAKFVRRGGRIPAPIQSSPTKAPENIPIFPGALGPWRPWRAGQGRIANGPMATHAPSGQCVPEMQEPFMLAKGARGQGRHLV
jgi:uncharacterized protein (UPF0210 family)